MQPGMLMCLSSLLLQPRTGRRPMRAHEGTVVAPASNQRRASRRTRWTAIFRLLRQGRQGEGSVPTVCSARALTVPISYVTDTPERPSLEQARTGPPRLLNAAAGRRGPLR
jgi:hypothetical protein